MVGSGPLRLSSPIRQVTAPAWDQIPSVPGMSSPPRPRSVKGGRITDHRGGEKVYHLGVEDQHKCPLRVNWDWGLGSSL